MINLIRRDVIIQKKQLLLFIPFIIIFIIMDSHPILIFLLASIFIPFNTYAYDEKAETNILLNSLPYTRKEIIASRYLGAIIYMALAIGMTSLALFIFNKPFAVSDIGIGGGLFLLFASFTFPLFYIFKPGSITLVVFISFFLLAAGGPSIIRIIAKHSTVITDYIFNLSNPTLYIGSTIIIAVLYIISWSATLFVYQRKAF